MPGATLYSNPDALHASQMLNQLILQADGPANHHSILCAYVWGRQLSTLYMYGLCTLYRVL